MRFFVTLSLAVSVCEATSPGLRRYRNVLEISDLHESAAKAAASASVSGNRNDNKHRIQLQQIHHVHDNDKQRDNRKADKQMDAARTFKKGAKGEMETRIDGKKKKDKGVKNRNDETFGVDDKNLDEIFTGNTYGSLSYFMSMPSKAPTIPNPTPPVAPATTDAPAPVTTETTAPVDSTTVTPAPYASTTFAPVAAPVVAPVATPVVATVPAPVTPSSVTPVILSSTIPTDFGTSTPTVSGDTPTAVVPSTAPVVYVVPSAPITGTPVAVIPSEAPAAPVVTMPVAVVPSAAPVATTITTPPVGVPIDAPAVPAPITVPPALLISTKSPIAPTLTSVAPLTPVIIEFSRSPVSKSATDAPFGGMPSPGIIGIILPTAPLTRDEKIVMKCNITTDERFASMIEILTNVTDVVQMRAVGSPQNLALNWLDVDDDAIICPDVGRFTQRYLAAVFYYGMGGTTWINCRAEKDGGNCVNVTSSRDPIRFLSAEHECYWFGLGCGVDVPLDLSADDPRDLILIELPENNLMGSLVSEIFALRSLQVLTMDGNLKITGTIPSLIGDLMDLEFIDMDTNALTGSLPSELWQLSKMRVIDLNSNEFTGTLSPEIRNLVDLNVLQLENNKLTGPIPTDSLLNMTKMGKSSAHIFLSFTCASQFFGSFLQ